MDVRGSILFCFIGRSLPSFSRVLVTAKQERANR